MATVVETSISPSVLAELECSYDFGDTETVRQFLLGHPSIGPLLRDARDELAARFGSQVRTVLAVIDDPEEEDAGMLYAFVQTEDDPERALDRLDSFNDEWWRVAIGSAPVPLHFALEYV
jgi:hypothetical protein